MKCHRSSGQGLRVIYQSRNLEKQLLKKSGLGKASLLIVEKHQNSCLGLLFIDGSRTLCGNQGPINGQPFQRQAITKLIRLPQQIRLWSRDLRRKIMSPLVLIGRGFKLGTLLSLLSDCERTSQ